MSKKTSNPESETLRLDYDLLSLPTAQHKSGLAGLLMMLESLRRRKIGPIPVVLEQTPYSAAIEVSPATLRIVFDDLFAAEWVEVASSSKWSGKEPKRIEEEAVTDDKGKTKSTKRYIYDVVQPSGAFLKTLYPEGSEVWLKLWRDMLWQTLRGIPTTRGVYEERAEGGESSVTTKVWSGLVKSMEASAQGGFRTEPIASSLFIGAQDENAEKVPFQGQPEMNLLLHFALIPCLIFAPKSFKVAHHAEGELTVDTEDIGYVLAIPEPSHLDWFVESCLDMMATLDPTVAGYRPKAAVIDVPAEGGLEYLYHLSLHTVLSKEVSDALAAVEIFHLEKRGNNVKMLIGERIAPEHHMIRDYALLREQCRNPDFKACRIRSLLEGKPWYASMGAVLSTRPQELIVYKAGKTPARIPYFAVDVKKTFSGIKKDLEQRKGDATVADETSDDALARRIYDLITQYVRRRTEEKSGAKYDAFKGNKNEKGTVIYPAKYVDALEKVCSDAFLAMRGRTDQAFIEYFTGTVCSVPQFLPQAEYLAVSRALMTDPERVKALSMLALSANSYHSS